MLNVIIITQKYKFMKYRVEILQCKLPYKFVTLYNLLVESEGFK